MAGFVAGLVASRVAGQVSGWDCIIKANSDKPWAKLGKIPTVTNKGWL